MIEFKKLSEVEAVEAPADTANVLIEEDGVIKKVTKDAVGGSSSWNDLKDRPFGEEVQKTVVMPEQTLTFNENWTAQYALEGVSIGDTVEVVLDGTTYECEVIQLENSFVFGNASCVGLPENEYPFGYIGSEGGFILYNYNMAQPDLTAQADHTLSVSVVEKSIKTLDPKYLPFVTLFDSENGVKADVSIEQIKAASNKAPVFAQLCGMVFRFEWISDICKWAHESVYVDNGEFTLMYKTFVYNEETTEWEFGEDRYFPLTTTDR